MVFFLPFQIIKSQFANSEERMQHSFNVIIQSGHSNSINVRNMKSAQGELSIPSIAWHSAQKNSCPLKVMIES